METSRFWERFLGAVKPLKLKIEKVDSSLLETQRWLMDGGALSAVKVFLFLERYDALGSLENVQEMMNAVGCSTVLKQKVVSHLYRIDREELIEKVYADTKRVLHN